MKMLHFFIFLLVGLLEFTLCAHLKSSNTESYQKGENKNPHEIVSQRNNNFNLKVGLYVKDYSGKTVKIVGETTTSTNSSEVEVLTLTLPSLKVEDHIWDGKSITLECGSSRYPVFWEYHGLGTPQIRVTTERKAVNFYDKSSYSYKSVVTFPSTNHKQTGRYTCRRSNSADDGTGVSVYLFVPGNMLFVVVNEDLNNTNKSGVVTIVENGSNPWVILPCAPSVQDAVVELYALGSETGRIKLEESKYLKYDPMEGFKLAWKEREERAYLCVGKTLSSATEEDLIENKLLIELVIMNSTIGSTKLGDELVPLFQPTIEYNSSTHSIECCAQNINPTTNDTSEIQDLGVNTPWMKLFSCVSISDCHFSSQLYSTSETSKFSRGQANESDPFMKVINSDCVAYKLPKIARDAGVLKCFPRGWTEKVNHNDKVVAELQFSFTPNHGLVTDFATNDVETSKILEIGREQKDKEGSTAVYFCNPDQFFFSTGIKWAIQTKEGDGKGLQFLNENDGRPSLEVDETKVARVYCFAPIWNSATDWRNASIIVSPISTL